MKNSKNTVFLVWGAVLGVVLAASIAGNVALGVAVNHWRDNDPQFLLKRAADEFARKDYVAAGAWVRRVLSVAPRLPEPYVLDGHIHYDLKQWGSALDSYRKAIETGSRNPNVYGRILWCLMNQSHFKEAAEFGRGAIEQGNGLPLLYGYTAEAYLRAGQQAEAIPLLVSALAADSANLHYLHRLEQAYLTTGQKEKAAAISRRIEEADTALNATH